MRFLVDTSVWSLALRRDRAGLEPAVERVESALRSGELVAVTGEILQELLQGFQGPRDSKSIVERFAALELLVPTRDDHIAAASIRNTCRRKGIQIGTIDALLAQLAIGRELTLLTTDNDFAHVAEIHPLSVWSGD